jgi:DNA (cytosine-5)-methyltransferase 1
MKCAHLFNGISGFGLAAHWMGWSNVMHCEIDPFCNRVMNYHFPNSFQHEDIRTTDFRIWRGRIDLLTGGFPCQPFSSAGKRLGKEDERHLWPEMLRAIREISPRWVVGENVRGLINWNRGLVFDEVQSDLEAAGYEVIPFLLPACGVNAVHERYRVWPVAYAAGNNGNDANSIEGRKAYSVQEKRFDEPAIASNTNNLLHQGELDNRGDTSETAGSEGKNEQQERRDENRQWVRDQPGTGGEVVANTELFGQQGQRWPIKSSDTAPDRNWKASWSYDDGRWPTKPGVCYGDDGFPGQLDNITFLDWYEGSLKALGNAIVPQVAHQIFKAIEQYELHHLP